MPDIKLTQLQRDILNFFGKNQFGKNFYWTGGTLLSYYYLRHRYSFDLDFFSDDLFSSENYLVFINDLKKEIKAKKITSTLQHNRYIYFVERDKETVKLELVYFPFPSIEKRKLLTEFSVKIDSLTDIMVNKILSIYQRQEPKDVFDLYFYLDNKPKYNLQKLVNLVEKKFGITIEPIILIAKINELSIQLDSISPFLIVPQKNLGKKVKEFFQKIFNSLAKKQLKK